MELYRSLQAEGSMIDFGTNSHIHDAPVTGYWVGPSSGTRGPFMGRQEKSSLASKEVYMGYTPAPPTTL